MRPQWKQPKCVGFIALGLALLAAAPAALAQQPQIPNPSVETPDPQDATKPQGWYRQTYVNDENPPSPTGPWRYITNGTPGDTTHTGTHSVAVTGGNAGTIYSWEMEGQTAGKGATWDANLNPDNRGQGPFAVVVPGGLYRVSAWYKKTFVGGDSRLRYTFSNTAAGGNDDAAVWTGGSQVNVAADVVNEWVQLSAEVTAPAANNRLILRGYSVNVPAGQTIYWDDFSVELLGLPETFTGVVRNSQGEPIADAGVGARLEGANGLADPEAAVKTDAAGAFSLTLVKRPGNYVVQAWLPGNTASANVPLLAAGTPTNITYDPAPRANLAVGKPVVAFSSYHVDNNSQPPSDAVDGSLGTRWSSRGEDVITFPHFFVVDLGTPIDFGTTVQQINIWWETALANKYQIRVSNTPPDPAMSGLTGNHALALDFGTVIYDSPAGAATRNYNPASGQFVDVITGLTPATGRYIMLLSTERFGGFTNISVWEFQVFVPATVVTGRVVDSTGTAVPNAILVPLPAGSSTFSADAEGNFSITLPRTGAASNYFATALTGASVYAESAPFAITPEGETMNIGNITIGGPAPNEVPVGAAIDTYAAVAPGEDIDDSGNPRARAVDQDYTTRWSSASILDIDQNVTPTTPLYLVIDMGAAKTINTLIIDWETARPSQYRVQVASTYNFAGRSGGNWEDVRVSATPPDDNILFNWGGGDYIEIIRFPARSAQYIRIVMEKRLEPYTNFSIWEVQAANLAAPVIPLANALTALRIAGGLEAAPANISSLNVVTTGDSATVIDLLDVVELARQGQ